MSRWLCVDHGEVRIGVAAGDTETGIASPLEVVPALPLQAALAQIVRLASQSGAEGIVVGLPLNMDDTEGPQATAARQFALRLQQASGLPVRLWDERLSSFSADQSLRGQLTRKKKKQWQDAVAAAAILHDFFARGGPDVAPTADQPR